MVDLCRPSWRSKRDYTHRTKSACRSNYSQRSTKVKRVQPPLKNTLIVNVPLLRIVTKMIMPIYSEVSFTVYPQWVWPYMTTKRTEYSF